MKVGIIGTGRVGSACALALAMRGCAREIVLVNRTRERAHAVAIDLRCGVPLLPMVDVRDGDYSDLAGAEVIAVTVGINEKTGGAAGRDDPQGRLKLLGTNAGVYEQVIPKVAEAAPEALLLVVTDPPDPLADIARRLARHDRVLSTGTFLDSLRLRVDLAERFAIDPADVEAQVVGEHGDSSVFLWSTAQVGGVAVLDLAHRRGLTAESVREDVERGVRDANVTIIEGNEASQFGIAAVVARLAEIVVRDERAVVPIGSYSTAYGVTLSLPSVVGRRGAIEILEPEMSQAERQALQRSAETLKEALQGTNVTS